MTQQIADSEDPKPIANPADRRGTRSTEFWLALAGKAAGIGTLVFATNSYVQIAGAVLAAISGGSYSVSRGHVKEAHAVSIGESIKGDAIREAVGAAVSGLNQLRRSDKLE